MAGNLIGEALSYALAFVAGMGAALFLVWLENRQDR